MKVLLVSTSPRIGGNTFTALSEAVKILEQEGISTELIEIGQHHVRDVQHANSHLSILEHCLRS